MAKLFNRARMTVTSTGTGTLTLGSAASGYQTFASAGVANGDVVSYAIEDGANWEIGTGTYTSSGTTLSRTVSASSNSNTAISVTTSAQVFITALAADIPVVGTSAQAWDADLDAIAALSGTSGLLKKTAANTWSLDTGTYLSSTLSNTAVTGFKTATFNSQTTIATTTGSITVDWTSAQNQKQTEPTGSITYTFTAPPGPCHLQLLIDSDGTSTAQTFTWPGTVIWIGSVWAAAANKKAIVNFWYDGTNYYAMGANQP